MTDADPTELEQRRIVEIRPPAHDDTGVVSGVICEFLNEFIVIAPRVGNDRHRRTEQGAQRET